MKQFGRVIQIEGKWFLLYKDASYPIKGGSLKLANGSLVAFYLKNLNSSIFVKDISLLAEPVNKFLTLEDNCSLKKLFTNRVNYFQSLRGKKLLFLRSHIIQEVRKIFLRKKFIEVSTPYLVSSVSDGKVARFKVSFDKTELFLAMTFLPYLNLLCYADNEKVFQIGDVFQSGQSNGLSQVNEYLVVDWAHCVFNKNIKTEIKFINTILLAAVKSFNKLDFVSKDLQVDESDFSKIPIIPYQELALEKKDEEHLPNNQKHIPVRVLESVRLKNNDIFWIYNFPKDFKPFYCDSKKDGAEEFVVSAELWWRGFKIATTSLTQNNLKKQKERIKYLGLDYNNYSFYLDAMSNGVMPTFVSTINFDRLIAKLLKMRTVKEAILFPRSTRNTVVKP
jgi:aspartyl/asparaginyl-tRNA synthetase